MKDSKTTVRYLGFKVLFDGSRRFDFSFESADASLHLISVQASHVLFSGPGYMSIQECPGICYETLKCRVDGRLELCTCRYRPQACLYRPTPQTVKNTRAL